MIFNLALDTAGLGRWWVYLSEKNKYYKNLLSKKPKQFTLINQLTCKKKTERNMF